MDVHYSISKDLIDRLWLKSKESMNIFRSMDGSSYKEFQRLMLQSDMVIEWDFGALRIDGIFTKQARVHGIFWSKDVFRNVNSMRRALMRLGRVFGVEEIFCEFPRGSRSIRSLITKGGFVPYGTGSFHTHADESVRTDIYVLQLQ